MAEENQVTKEPQQITKEPQRVTTKNPKKVEAGKRLVESNHRKREQKKREEQTKLEASREKPILWYRSCYSSGSDRWSWLLHLSNQESRATTKNNPKPLPQAIAAQPQTNKFEMDYIFSIL